MDNLKEAPQPVGVEEVEIDLSDNESIQVRKENGEKPQDSVSNRIEKVEDVTSPQKSNAHQRPSIAYKSSEAKIN